MPLAKHDDPRICKTCIHNQGSTCGVYVDAVTGLHASLIEARRIACEGRSWEGRDIPSTTKALWASDRKTYQE